MNLIGYRKKIGSASQVAQDMIEQYDYLAQIIITNDDNANGEAELRFVDKDGIRQPVTINLWTLSSQVKIKYWYGQCTLELNITSPSGLSKLMQLDVKSGSQSPFWGVSTLSTVMPYLLELAKSKSWEYQNKVDQLQAAKNKLNAVLLEAEQLHAEVNALQDELKELE